MHIDTKFLQKLPQEGRWFVLSLFACLAGGVAQAQTLSFAPGLVTALSSTNSTTGSASATYTGPLSGLILTQPQALTYDSQGDLFIVDGGANVVRVVASGKGPIPSLPSVPSPVAGTVYTVAGTGSNKPSTTALCAQDQRGTIDSKFYGNGCPATAAILFFLTPSEYDGFNNQYSAPIGQVALDANGNLYIADPGDNQVRVVYAGGSVPGLLASLPNGVTPTPGSIYALAGSPINQSRNNKNPDGSVNLPPVGVVLDASGDVYILFYYNGPSVLRISDLAVIYNGGTLPPILAGTALTMGQYAQLLVPGVGPYNPAWRNPTALALDSSGNIYLSDANNSTNSVYVIYAGGNVPGLSATLKGQAPIVGNSYLFASDNQFAAGDEFTGNNPTGLATDPAGDVYMGLDPNGRFGPNYMAKVDTSGNVAIFAGNLSYDNDLYQQFVCSAAVDTFGDGCPASQVVIGGPMGVTLAPDGSIEFSDIYTDPNTTATYFALRRIDGSTSTLTFPTETAGVPSPAQVVTISNVAAQPLNISAINIPNNFTQAASGGTDCSAPVTLQPGQSCLLGIQFLAAQSGSYSSNITITSDSTNAASGVNSIAVTGTATASTGASAQTITFTAPSTATYGQTITLNGTASSGLPLIYQASGPGRIQGNKLTVTGVGAITVTAYQPGDNGDTGNKAGWAAATPVPVTISAQAATLTVTADNISQARTIPIPPLTYTITGFANGETQTTSTTGTPSLSTTATSSSASGTYPITLIQGTLSTTSNYSLTFQNGTFTILPGQPQIVTFTQTLPTVTYSATAINLTGAATSTSGLPVTYTVTGPAMINGSILTLTGAGTVTVTANQAGDVTYAPASPVKQSFLVQPATLTLTADNLTMAQGSAVPALTYTVGGLLNGDKAPNVVSGNPILTTAATASSPLGVYQTTIAQGTVKVLSANYAVTSASFVNGTMTVVQGQPQTISFGGLPDVTYGVAPLILSATASSGLPVTFSVSSGPASIANNVLSVTGAGAVIVTANQAGNATYSPATPAKQSFTVVQAPLTIAANNVTRLNNTPNPPLTFTVSGLANGDTAAVLSNNPVMSTTATPYSPPGSYPINIGPLDPFGGVITATNYTINGFVSGTLTITSGGQAPDFIPTLSTPTLTILDGQVGQVTVTVTPVNYYGGVVNLSCTGLPANISCVFSPASINVSLTQKGTLTIATSNAPIVASLPHSGSKTYSAAIAGWVSLLFGLILAGQRKKLVRYKRVGMAVMAVCLFGMAVNMTGCGGQSSSSSATNGLAAPGTSTIQVVATGANGGPVYSMPLVITVK